jgi:RNA recognition motif-containing protein
LQNGRKFRLFVGNLSETVKQEELREKFELLLKSSYQDGIRVGNVEVRCKNEDNYFGFVDVHTSVGGGEGPPPLVLSKGNYTI